MALEYRFQKELEEAQDAGEDIDALDWRKEELQDITKQLTRMRAEMNRKGGLQVLRQLVAAREEGGADVIILDDYR